MVKSASKRIMNDNQWHSTPSFFGQYKQLTVGACVLLGLIMRLVAFYVLAKEIHFYRNAMAFEATIVEVRQQYVPAGGGSMLAYFPVVEMRNSGPISVDTSSQTNVYVVGARMRVLCNLSVSQKCIEDTFFDKWWGIVDLIVALIFLVPSILYVRRSKKDSGNLLTLKVVH